jgi:hypothetical protein
MKNKGLQTGNVRVWRIVEMQLGTVERRKVFEQSTGSQTEIQTDPL